MEAAFVVPIIVILLLGTLEVGRLLEVQEVLNNAVREGARQGAGGQLTNAQVSQVVLNYLSRANVPTGSATVTVSDLTNPGTDCTAATQNDPIQVTVSLPFSSVRWTASNMVTSASSQLTANAVWYSARNLSYPTSITVPQGY